MGDLEAPWVEMAETVADGDRHALDARVVARGFSFLSIRASLRICTCRTHVTTLDHCTGPVTP